MRRPTLLLAVLLLVALVPEGHDEAAAQTFRPVEPTDGRRLGRSALEAFLSPKNVDRFDLKQDPELQITVPLRLERMPRDARAARVYCMAVSAAPKQMEKTATRGATALPRSGNRYVGYGRTDDLEIPAQGGLKRDVAVPVRLQEGVPMDRVGSYECVLQVVGEGGTACLPSEKAKDPACRAASGTLSDDYLLVAGALEQ